MAAHSKNPHRQTSRNWSHHARVDKRGVDIVDLIFEDHRPLKELIRILKNTELELEERRLAFESFAVELVAHAKPEEEVVYSRLKRGGELRDEAFAGDIEHGLADQLLEEAQRTENVDLWSARVEVLAKLVERHIRDEEERLLPKLKELEDEEIRSQLGDMFLQAKVKILERGGEDAPHENSLKH